MPMEICSENSTSSTLVMSPARISFSYDLSQSDAAVPLEHHLFRSNSSSSSGVDFDFCNNHGTCAQPSSSADELFSDGKILPIRIKETVAPPRLEIQQPEVLSPDLPCGKGEIDEGLKETKGAISESEEKHSSKSFWRFKRSSSLNRGSGYGPSLCPLPLLSRSNSTGSATSQKQNSKKNHPSVSVSKTSLQYSSTSGNHQKPPLKKSYGSYGGGGGGVPINPVLNVHSGNLFGLGSIFGKEKSKRK